MDDHEAFDNIATAILAWQVAAQQMPLAELTAMVANCQDDLAQSLDSFNALYDDHADHVPADTLQKALGAIARQATSAAIFTLGIACRAQQAAQQN
jgi:hypothetical protein